MAIINGTAAAETLLGGGGNDIITGLGGNDLVRMRGGDDVFVWNNGDGSDKVEGQDGFDTLRFTGTAAAETIDITANGTRARLSRDVDLVTMDLNEVERIQLRTLAGADTIAVADLSATHVQQVVIDLAGVVGGTVGDGVQDNITRSGSDGADTFNVTLAGGKVSVAGLSTLVAISHADANDILFIDAGKGNDFINASAVAAGAMQFFLGGGEGNDRITGSQGLDLLVGDVGNDAIIGGRGNDVAFLGAGNDLFVWNPGDGSDVVEGDADFDTLRFTGSSADESFSISANGGRAAVSRNIGAAILDINEIEQIQLRTLGGADSIVVNDLAGTDVTKVNIDLAAAAGGTLADSKVDVVTVNGTAGDDSITIASAGGGIVTTGLAASVSVAHAGAADILAIQGGVGNDVINASSVPAGKMSLQLLGNSGNDVIYGSDGADAVRGGSGSDVALMGGGNDVFFWSPGDGSDTIEGQAEFDTLYFSGANIIENFTISANGGRALVLRDVASITMDLNDVEQIRVQVLGGADNIVVNNLAGTDVQQVAIDLAGAIGGKSGDNQQDIVTAWGTLGNDSVTLSMSGTTVSVTGLPAQVTVAHADELDYLALFVSDGNDTVNAAAVPVGTLQVIVDGGNGNDLLSGSAADDGFYGGNGNDTLRGGGGNDGLFGDAGNDRLEGGAFSDQLFGGSDDDVLLGGLDDDRLTGGTGNDTITGGAGNDTVFYTSVADGLDVVLAFDGNPVGGQDILDLDQLFDSLGIAGRTGRVQVTDLGATVNVAVDADGNVGNGFELVVATLHTTDPITIGTDVIVGTL